MPLTSRLTKDVMHRQIMGNFHGKTTLETSEEDFDKTTLGTSEEEIHKTTLGTSENDVDKTTLEKIEADVDKTTLGTSEDFKGFGASPGFSPAGLAVHQLQSPHQQIVRNQLLMGGSKFFHSLRV